MENGETMHVSGTLANSQDVVGWLVAILVDCDDAHYVCMMGSHSYTLSTD